MKKQILWAKAFTLRLQLWIHNNFSTVEEGEIKCLISSKTVNLIILEAPEILMIQTQVIGLSPYFLLD
jgi:hypothetical protein